MNTRRSAKGLVAALGLLTFGMTLVRLYGERTGSIPLTSGGVGVLLGISFLPPLIGFVFGWWLCGRDGRPERPGRLLGRYAAGFLLALGWTATWVALLRAYPFQYTFMLTPPVWMAIAWWVGRSSWPELAQLNFAYGLIARVGVIAVTLYCLFQGWDTHYTRLGPEERRVIFSPLWTGVVTVIAQLALWVPFTVLTGGLGGALAAVMRRR
jgi:hypothetical protein